jgi:hypothetical protein
VLLLALPIVDPADPWDKFGMAHRAHLRLLLALVLLCAAQFLLRGAETAQADLMARHAASIARNAAQAQSTPQYIRQSVDSRIFANSLPYGGKRATAFGQWNDNDDPDDMLQAEGVSIALPPLISGFGRRVGHAVARESIVSSAFPRGPPAL